MRGFTRLITILSIFIISGISVNYIYFTKIEVGEGRVLVEYNQWENRLLLENPRYEDLKILVDISDKKLYLINNQKLIKSYTIASGKPDSPSPLGSWRIINKARWGGGFGTRWMGLNVPWGSYGIHGTNRPRSIGYDASAGCIRMRNQDVEDLYKYVKVGTPVAIVNGLMGPFGYGLKPIEPGAIGADVMEIQSRLRALGYYNVERLDGKYGPYMEQALYKFQSDNGIIKNPVISYETFRALGIIMMD